MTTIKADGPLITRSSLFNIQVCVPKDWTDEQVVEWANSYQPTGIQSRWAIVTDPERLAHDPVREQCFHHPNKVHLLLEC